MNHQYSFSCGLWSLLSFRSFESLVVIPTVSCIPHSHVGSWTLVAVGGGLALQRSCFNPLEVTLSDVWASDTEYSDGRFLSVLHGSTSSHTETLSKQELLFHLMFGCWSCFGDSDRRWCLSVGWKTRLKIEVKSQLHCVCIQFERFWTVQNW